MTDIERILPLWRELEAASVEYVLATVVAVEGSSYRKPGACMLLSPDGRRAGTVSGGCLEAEVARRAWWLTENGPVVQRYSSIEEDGDFPYGSGCGGVVFLLLERRPTAHPLLNALEHAFHLRTRMAVATVLGGTQIGQRAFAGLKDRGIPSDSVPEELRALAGRALERESSIESIVSLNGETRAWADFRPARPGLWIFGAGDDALPLVSVANELGWFVSVADGRSQLATRARFNGADELHVLDIKDLTDRPLARESSPFAQIHPTDAAVLLTHSFEQDSCILAALLSLKFRPAYIGVLGPQRRTRELLTHAARMLGLSEDPAQVERLLAQLYAPMGLDLGAESPETIALSVVAEIQQTFTAATALALRQVRATSIPSPS